MPNSCLLCGISKTEEKLSYFKFPSDVKSKEKWITLCGLKPEAIKPASLLCSLHFTDNSFTNSSAAADMKINKKRLKKDALPSIFNFNQPSVSTTSKTIGICFLCGTYTTNAAANLSFHRFPSNKDKCLEWLNFCQADLNVNDVSNSRLCSKHFAEEDFINVSKKARRLLDTAIPKLNLPEISHFEKRKLHHHMPVKKNCVICGPIMIDSKHASFFKFPQDSEIRKQWITACGLDPKQSYDKVFLCSKHFENSSISNNSDQAQRIRLKKYAVPTQYLHLNINSNSCSVSAFSTSTTLAIEESVIQMQDEEMNSPAILESSIEEQSIVQSHIMETNSTSDPSNDFSLTPKKEASKKINIDHSYGCLTKKVLHSPRYVEDISSPHLATPRRAKKSFLLAKSNILQQRKCIKSLQEQLRSNKNKIKKLRDVIINLRDTHRLTYEAAEQLMVIIYT